MPDHAHNSGWRIDDGDPRTGDHVKLRGDRIARLVRLPEEPPDERDPDMPPGCSYCNSEQAQQDRIVDAAERGKEADGIVAADYALVDGNEVVAFTCHACICDAPVKLREMKR